MKTWKENNALRENFGGYSTEENIPGDVKVCELDKYWFNKHYGTECLDDMYNYITSEEEAETPDTKGKYYLTQFCCGDCGPVCVSKDGIWARGIDYGTGFAPCELDRNNQGLDPDLEDPYDVAAIYYMEISEEEADEIIKNCGNTSIGVN